VHTVRRSSIRSLANSLSGGNATPGVRSALASAVLITVLSTWMFTGETDARSSWIVLSSQLSDSIPLDFVVDFGTLFCPNQLFLLYMLCVRIFIRFVLM
jgi:hypothetical protein